MYKNDKISLVGDGAFSSTRASLDYRIAGNSAIIIVRPDAVADYSEMLRVIGNCMAEDKQITK